jgi:hypothetical protein
MIAASAIASLPFIKILSDISSLPFYLDDTVGAHHRAGCAADAFFHIDALGGVMTLLVDFVCGDLQDALGAGVNAQRTTFTVVGFECQLCHIHIPFSVILLI